MRLEVKRLDRDGRYETVITRGDGVSFRVLGVGHAFAIPHDLAHYAVEKALRLDNGFWGSVAAGAVFRSMTYLGGRRKPKATEKSAAVLKANARALGDAEILVRIFNDTIEDGYGETSPILMRRSRERLPMPESQQRPINADDIAAVYATYREIQREWEALPIGGILMRLW